MTGLGVIFVVVDIDFIIGLEVAVFVEEEEEAAVEDSGTTDTDVTDRFGEVRKEGDEEESFGVTDGEEEEEESRLLSECPLFPHWRDNLTE